MKKNKGFTLIELLAVIVILALLAFIATPLLLQVVEKSKMKSLQNSAYHLLDAAQIFLAENMIEDNSLEYTFIVKDHKFVLSTDTSKALPYKGDSYDGGQLVINNTTSSIRLIKDAYCAKKQASEKEVRIYQKDCVTTLDGKKEEENTTLDPNVKDNWLTLLKLANLDVGAYTARDLLENETVIEQIANSDEAMTYLMESDVFLNPVLFSNGQFIKGLDQHAILIPQLTDNTTCADPNVACGVASSPSVCENYNVGWISYAYRAFNGSSWMCNSYGGQWIMYEYPTPVQIYRIENQNYYNASSPTSGASIGDFKLQYSDDGIEFKDALVSTFQQVNVMESKFVTENVGRHKYWRVYIINARKGTSQRIGSYGMKWYAR